MIVQRGIVAVAVLGGLLLGCGGSAPPQEREAQPQPASAPETEAQGKVVARYGPQTLTAGELVVELERVPERSRRMMSAEGRKKFVENYVLNELLFAEGEGQGIAKDPEVERQVNDLRKRLVVQRLVRGLQSVPPITDEQVRAHYDANPGRFSTTTIRARHILVKDEAKAKELHAQVTADPAKFAELAQANSTDSASAKKGGDLGFFGRGRMVPEFEAAAFALERPGQISEPVKTSYGYHVIQLEEIREGTQKPLEQVKEQIRATLRNQALQARTTEYYEQLKQRAGVVIDVAVIEEVATSLPQAAPSKQGSDGAALPSGHPPIGGHPSGP